MPHNGTVVEMGFTRTDTDNSGFQITADGAVLFTEFSTSLANIVTNINADVSANQVIAIKNNGPNDVSDVSGWIKIKLRG